MHIINLSLDQSLFNIKKIGDSHERFVAYSRGCESFVVVVPTKLKVTTYKQDGVTYIPGIGSNHLAAFINTLKHLQILVSQQKNSIIICNDPVLGFIALLVKARFPKIKIQINSLGTRLNQWRWLFEKPYNPLFWLISLISLKGADSIRTDSQEDKKIIQKFTHKNEKDFLVLPVPPSSYFQQRLLSLKPKQKFSYPIKLLAIGSMTKNKDFPTLIRAVSKIDNTIHFHLTLIGSGPEEQSIKEMISSLQLTAKASFIASVDYEKLLDYYESSDIFISSSRIEGLPRVLQEAALAGLPIITTDFNGAKDLIFHTKTGLIVSIGDSNALAQAVESLIINPRRALIIAKNGRAFAQDFCNFAKVVNRLQDSWRLLGNQI